MQCLGKNKRKEQCRRQADSFVGYCFYHLKDKQETRIPAPRQPKEEVKPVPVPRQSMEKVKPVPTPRQRRELVKPVPTPRETSAFPVRKPTPKPTLRKTAFRGFDNSYSLGIDNKELDPKYILARQKPQIKQVLEDELKKSNNIEVVTTSQIDYSMSAINDEKEVKITANHILTQKQK